MIRVTVELVSAIHPSRSRVLGVAEIANVTSTHPRADYSVRLSKWAPKLEETWKRGLVRNFDRARLGPWDLLLRSLAELVGARNDLRDLACDSTWDDDVAPAEWGGKSPAAKVSPGSTGVGPAPTLPDGIIHTPGADLSLEVRGEEVVSASPLCACQPGRLCFFHAGPSGT